MPVHEFKNDLSVPRNEPNLRQDPSTVKQISDVSLDDNNDLLPLDYPLGQYDVAEYRDHLQRGFYYLDEAMKNYWSDIRVPTKDSYRFLNVKVAGGDRSVMIWADDLKNGRVRMPIAAIDRTSSDHNKEKWAHSIHPMRIRFASPSLDKVILTYKPSQWLVAYKLVVWTTNVRDIDFIDYQVLNRFKSGMAEFTMSDELLTGNVQLRFNGSSDATDKEVSADVKIEYRYEYNMEVEAWLSLPEVVLPTALGSVNMYESVNGEQMSLDLSGRVIL